LIAYITIEQLPIQDAGTLHRCECKHADVVEVINNFDIDSKEYFELVKKSVSFLVVANILTCLFDFSITCLRDFNKSMRLALPTSPSASMQIIVSGLR
jgi:hypothetical protein